MLTDYCDNNFTDKNTTHSYIDLYQTLFESKKESATHILEIGIGPTPHANGGSIMMWADYFTNANIYSTDIISIDAVRSALIVHPRIHLYTSNNAYNANFVKSAFLSKNIQLDMMLDDGPHTLESMIDFIQLYSPLMKADGILAIEDLQNIRWIDTLKAVTPDALKPFIQVYDRQQVKGRYDDIVFVINKSVIH